MMYIKIIFLGFLRNLNQLDQAYTKMLMEVGGEDKDAPCI